MALDNAVDSTRGDAPGNAPGSTDTGSAGAVDAVASPFREAEWRSVARAFQLVLILAAGLAVVSLAVGFALGAPLGGAFGVIGLGLGAYNGRRLWTDTTNLKGEIGDARKQMGAASLRRLGLVTLLAFLIALLYRDQGWAVFIGIVAFQFLMVSLLIGPIKRAARVF